MDVNGTSSTDDTTYYIYDNPGTYTVILTITDIMIVNTG